MDLQKLTKIEPFAVGFLTADREDRCYKIAYALKFMAENLELKMDLKNWFQAPVKSFVPYSIGFSRADGICVRDHENGVITPVKTDIVDHLDPSLVTAVPTKLRDIKTES